MEEKTKKNSLNCVERWNVSFSHQLWTILLKYDFKNIFNKHCTYSHSIKG